MAPHRPSRARKLYVCSVVSDRILRKIAFEIIISQIRSVRNSTDGFTISGTDWAMKANTSFWDSLNQLILKQEPERRSFKCCVTHSSNPRIWSGEDALHSLTL